MGTSVEKKSSRLKLLSMFWFRWLMFGSSGRLPKSSSMPFRAGDVCWLLASDISWFRVAVNGDSNIPLWCLGDRRVPGVRVGVVVNVSNWPGDFADLVDRMDLETLRVSGLCPGVGRVGVLNGLSEGDFPVGVDGRACSFPISSSNSLSSSASTSSPSIAGGQFSLSWTSIMRSFGEWKFVATVTTLVATSPKTIGDPSFLGEGKSSLRVEPIGSSSRSMGLCCVPAHRAGLDFSALLNASGAASDVMAFRRFRAGKLPLR